MSDAVNKPEHYARWAVEPVTFIMRNDMEYWRGNVIKYVSRAGYKAKEGMTQEEAEMEDLRKAQRYLEMRINQILGKDEL